MIKITFNFARGCDESPESFSLAFFGIGLAGLGVARCHKKVERTDGDFFPTKIPFLQNFQ